MHLILALRSLALAVLIQTLLVPTASAQSPEARERRLHVPAAEASSHLVNDWNRYEENYLPQYVGDDDPKTAWTLKTAGIGEWLRLPITPMEGATRIRLRVRNGYQKSSRLFAANARAKQVKLAALPSKAEALVELRDTEDWQEVAFEQPAAPLEAVELHVLSVYPGNKYDDLCLSDVQVYVTASTPENPAYEKQRSMKLLTWKKERLAAAKLFASKIGQTMPVAPAYVLSGKVAPGDEPNDRCPDRLCLIRENVEQVASPATHARASVALAKRLAAANFAGMAAGKVITHDKRPMPRMDGVCAFTLDACLDDPCYEAMPLPTQIGFLNAQSLRALEQAGGPSVADVLANKPPQCNRRRETTFYWFLRDEAQPATALRAVLMVTCGLVEGREGAFPAAQPRLLVYGEAGELQVIASDRQFAILDWGNNTSGASQVAGASVTSYGSGFKFEARPMVAGR